MKLGWTVGLWKNWKAALRSTGGWNSNFSAEHKRLGPFVLVRMSYRDPCEEWAKGRKRAVEQIRADRSLKLVKSASIAFDKHTFYASDVQIMYRDGGFHVVEKVKRGKHYVWEPAIAEKFDTYQLAEDYLDNHFWRDRWNLV